MSDNDTVTSWRENLGFISWPREIDGHCNFMPERIPKLNMEAGEIGALPRDTVSTEELPTVRVSGFVALRLSWA